MAGGLAVKLRGGLLLEHKRLLHYYDELGGIAKYVATSSCTNADLSNSGCVW